MSLPVKAFGRSAVPSAVYLVFCNPDSMNKKNAAVAMSGGVDSSVAAAILKSRGYDILGLTLKHFSMLEKENGNKDPGVFGGPETVESARQIAAKLGIDHVVLDAEDVFAEKVVADFLAEYSRGRTPNPCIRCNEFIKFGVLMDKASKLGMDFLATGHHARVEWEAVSGVHFLKKGKDENKDQSYFLYRLTQNQLGRTLFPVGDLTKTEVRNAALSLGLPAAGRPESQEVCFIPDNDYVRFLEERIPEPFRPGFIVDREGLILGEHKGIARFTIGQRRGLGISSGRPLYVIEIRPEKNEIVVGPDGLLYKKELVASDFNLIHPAGLRNTRSVQARIRYKHRAAEAALDFLDSGHVRVEFERPQRAVTPGQAVVFYRGDTVIGGGTILGSAEDD